MSDFKADQIASASPAIQAIGVPDSLDANAEYQEYDVNISVTYSPKSGQMAQVANTTIRMTRNKFASFREDTNLWDGKKFLEEYFPDQLKTALKNKREENRPQVYVVNQNPLQNDYTRAPAQSSVDTTPAFGELVPAEVQEAPENPKQSDYVAPLGGPEQHDEDVVPNFPYEANMTNDFAVDSAVLAAEGIDPQLPEQEGPNVPEQDGTNTAEQPKAAEVVEAVQGFETTATKASKASAKKK